MIERGELIKLSRRASRLPFVYFLFYLSLKDLTDIASRAATRFRSPKVTKIAGRNSEIRFGQQTDSTTTLERLLILGGNRTTGPYKTIRKTRLHPA